MCVFIFGVNNLSLSTDIYFKDMGLGKTLSVLALICTSLDIHANTEGLDQSQGCRRTLIIAPKSSRLTQAEIIFSIY